MKKSVFKSTIKSISKSTVKCVNIETEILNVIKESEKPLSTTDIAHITKKNWHTIIRHCLDLQYQNKISRLNYGRISVWQIKN